MADDRDPNKAETSLDELYGDVAARGNVPAHIAVIMDGNGRWAKKRMLPRIAGHRAGRHSVRRVVSACANAGVEILTLYTFSKENWKRPEKEVKALWMFLEEVLGSEIETLSQKNVRLEVTGELDVIPDRARKALDAAVAKCAANDGLVLNLALAYGGRSEVVHAARSLARRAAAGELDPETIDEDSVRQGLYQPDLPDPDLVVRTSGEYRLSNFLIWQAAYAEMYFTPVFWPDFGERDLLLAIRDYQNRDRRYGGLKNSSDGAGENAGLSLLDPKRWKRILKVRS